MYEVILIHRMCSIYIINIWVAERFVYCRRFVVKYFGDIKIEYVSMSNV